LLRIAVAILVLLSKNEIDVARVVVERPPAMWVIPEGLGWLPTLITPRAVSIAIRILQASAVLSLLGVWTRVALPVLAASFFYVFGVAQLTGTVLHDMHLFWFLALLAVARVPSRLSLESWAGGPKHVDPKHADLTLSIARLWLGLVYFFPGFHKLLHGPSWLSGATLRGQLYFKWFEAGAVPWPRIDRVPALLGAMACAVVLIELAIPFLLLKSRRLRLVAMALAISFHMGAGHFLDVLFPGLIACWVLAIGDAKFTRPRLSSSPLSVFAGVFTLAIVIQGLRGQTQSYPFACYPTFAEPALKEISDLAVDDEGGQTYRLPLRRRQDEWGMVWRLGGLYGDPIDCDRLRAFARTLGVSTPSRFYLEAYDLTPEKYGAPPVSRTLISACSR